MSQIDVTQVIIEVVGPFEGTTPTTPEAATARFAAGNGSEWYVVPHISDSGENLRSKVIKAIRVTGRMTNGEARVYGYDVAEPILVSDLEAGLRTDLHSVTRAQTFPDTTQVVQTARKQINVSNSVLHTCRIAGDDRDKEVRDRVDEILYEQAVQGSRR